MDRYDKSRELPTWFYILCLLLAVLFLAVGDAGAHTEHQVDPRIVRDQVDDRLAVLWSDIVQNQLLYHAVYGRFYQGITSNILPADGNEVDFIASLKPTDQKESWSEFWQFGDIPQRLPMALKIDTYENREGAGFYATVYVFVNGTLYSRSKSVGPLDKTVGWHVVTQ